MTKRFSILLLLLTLLGSMAMAQRDELQGSFPTNIGSQAILHLSSSATGTEEINWANDHIQQTLGEWTFKVDQKLTVNGYAFHIGPTQSVGYTENFFGNFFDNCTTEFKQGSTVIKSIDGCYTAYNDVTLKAGTYTLTLKALPISSAHNDFTDLGYEGQKVSLCLIGLTKSTGIPVKFTNSTFATLVDQEASTLVEVPGPDYTLEYTYGGYTLVDAPNTEVKNTTPPLYTTPTNIGAEEEDKYDPNHR